MSRNIPFFEMFSTLQLSGELRLKLLDALVTGASIDRASMSMMLLMSMKAELTDEEQDALRGAICEAYGFQKVELTVTVLAAASAKAAAAENSGGAKPKTGKILMGNAIKAKSIPMKDVSLKLPSVTVTGKVFSFTCEETRRPGMWRLHFEMTDYTNSIAVHKNLTAKEVQGLDGAIKPGMWLCVKGKMEPTWDGKDIQLNPYDINTAEHEGRKDTAAEKRVELHLHTKMSNMDALTDTKETVKRAIAWGHPAIAITDHGVAQSFPDAWHAAGDKIKILYGVEGYFVNNVDDRIVVHGKQDRSIDDEFVCFDIETTGLKVDREAITEIGAVVLKNGEIKERFRRL